MNAAKTIKSMWTVPTRKSSEQGAVIPAKTEPRAQSADTASPSNPLPELPPPGPLNVIVLSANPLPAPKSVGSQ